MKYQSGDSTKVLSAEIREICKLRKLHDMSCSGCRYYKAKSCPKAREAKLVNQEKQNSTE